MFQVVDNHVIKYIPPESYYPVIGKKRIQVKKPLACIVVGAESADPQFVNILKRKLKKCSLFVVNLSNIFTIFSLQKSMRHNLKDRG